MSSPTGCRLHCSCLMSIMSERSTAAAELPVLSPFLQLSFLTLAEFLRYICTNTLEHQLTHSPNLHLSYICKAALAFTHHPFSVMNSLPLALHCQGQLQKKKKKHWQPLDWTSNASQSKTWNHEMSVLAPFVLLPNSTAQREAFYETKVQTEQPKISLGKAGGSARRG